MSKPAPYCADCYFYVAGIVVPVGCSTPAQVKQGFYVSEFITDLDVGTCHRHAPSTLHGQWPAVEEGDFCGDFASVLEFNA